MNSQICIETSLYFPCLFCVFSVLTNKVNYSNQTRKASFEIPIYLENKISQFIHFVTIIYF